MFKNIQNPYLKSNNRVTVGITTQILIPNLNNCTDRTKIVVENVSNWLSCYTSPSQPFFCTWLFEILKIFWSHAIFNFFNSVHLLHWNPCRNVQSWTWFSNENQFFCKWTATPYKNEKWIELAVRPSKNSISIFNCFAFLCLQENFTQFFQKFISREQWNLIWRYFQLMDANSNQYIFS